MPGSGQGAYIYRAKEMVKNKEGLKWYEWAFCIIIIILCIPIILFERLRGWLEGGMSR